MEKMYTPITIDCEEIWKEIEDSFGGEDDEPCYMNEETKEYQINLLKKIVELYNYSVSVGFENVVTKGLNTYFKNYEKVKIEDGYISLYYENSNIELRLYYWGEVEIFFWGEIFFIPSDFYPFSYFDGVNFSLSEIGFEWEKYDKW